MKKSFLFAIAFIISIWGATTQVFGTSGTATICIEPDRNVSTLDVGDIFIANIRLSSISDYQLMAAQVVLEYNPDVLQIVDSSGNPATNLDCTIPCPDIRSSGNGGYFDILPFSIDAQNGKFSYTIAKSIQLANSDEELQCPTGNYTVVGIRFKILQTGDTGLNIDMTETVVFTSSYSEHTLVTNSATEIQIANATPPDIPTIKASYTILYNNKYHEQIRKEGETVNIQAVFTNTGAASQNLDYRIAEYGNNQLTSLTTQPSMVLPVGITTQNYTITFSDSVPDRKYLFWQEDSLTPAARSISLRSAPEDNYSDSFSEAQSIDMTKCLCGRINGASDVDIVKITPSYSGFYCSEITALGNVTAEIYKDGTLLSSANAADRKNVLMCSMEASQDYYVKFTGNADSDYDITAFTVKSLIPLEKNSAKSCSFTSNEGYRIYRFTPETSGEHIVTAFGSPGIWANIYGDDLSNPTVGDSSDVLFRLSGQMTANNDYYIAVFPTSDTSGQSCIMYIEEPFTLVSIQ